MKKTIIGLMLLGISSFAAAEDLVVNVKGMVCAFCAQGIEKAFSGFDEVDSVKVDLKSKKVHLDFKEGKALDKAKIEKVIQDAGYNVASIEKPKETK